MVYRQSLLLSLCFVVNLKLLFKKKITSFRELPGDPVVRTRTFTAVGPGSIPGQGTKILKAEWHGQKKKKTKKLLNK